MTNKEAIDFGEMWLEVHEDSKDSNTYEFVNVAIKALEQTRWIPVSERLPKEVGTYLITLKDGDVCLCDFNPYCFADRTSLSTVAIAWMPLPKPYTAESEDEK